MGFLVKQSNNTVTAISISRDNQHGVFSRAEIKDWRTIAPILTELLRQYGEQVLALNDTTNALGQPNIDNLIQKFSIQMSQKGLTKREAEISALILQGHSSWSVSAQLGISVGTVKVHRKNIYKKLKISSQAELFNTLNRALIQ